MSLSVLGCCSSEQTLSLAVALGKCTKLEEQRALAHKKSCDLSVSLKSRVSVSPNSQRPCPQAMAAARMPASVGLGGGSHLSHCGTGRLGCAHRPTLEGTHITAEGRQGRCLWDLRQKSTTPRDVLFLTPEQKRRGFSSPLHR